MNEESKDDVKRSLREVGVEIGKLLDQARAMFTEATSDAKDFAGRAVGAVRHDEDSPLATIEKLGELRDKNYLTEEEFQSKKAELLPKIT